MQSEQGTCLHYPAGLHRFFNGCCGDGVQLAAPGEDSRCKERNGRPIALSSQWGKLGKKKGCSMSTPWTTSEIEETII
jgi:hypothetical protein